MKPITQHLSKNIHTKLSVVKEVVFKKSKSVNNGEERSFHSDKKHTRIEEEKIQKFFDEDDISKKKTEISNEEYVDVKKAIEKEQIQSKDGMKKKEVHDKDSTEKKRKSLLWKDTTQVKAIQEHRLSGLELLDPKQELISQYVDNGCNESITNESRQSIIPVDSIQESVRSGILSENSVSSHKHKSPTKKVGQRKISEFFPSTS